MKPGSGRVSHDAPRERALEPRGSSADGSTLRIERAVVKHYRIPRAVWWPLPLVDKTLAIDAIELITCEIWTRGGVHGLGYTYTLGRGGAAVHALLARDILPDLVGLDVQSPQRLWSSLWEGLLRVGRAGVVPVALAALDLALWDALAVEAGLPLYAYLGAARSSIPAYGSAIDLGYTISELVESVQAYRDLGFSAVKVKVGHPVARDLERLRNVRAAIGDDVELMVDANLGWRLPEAARRAHLMERFNLAWIEEPLRADDVEGHARLQAQTTIPLAVGETLFSVGEFGLYAAADAARVLQPDVGRVGGITPWLQVAALAEAHRLPMAPHFMQDVHVHLLCAHPSGGILEYLPILDRMLVEPLAVTNGEALPPALPGLGMRFDDEVLQPHLLSRS